MAIISNNKFGIFTSLALLLKEANAYYCEWSLCDMHSYCCGNNQCCSNSNSPWFYWWAGAIVLLIMIWVCNGCLRYYRAKNNQTTTGIRYQDLETANRQLEEKHAS